MKIVILLLICMALSNFTSAMNGRESQPRQSFSWRSKRPARYGQGTWKRQTNVFPDSVIYIRVSDNLILSGNIRAHCGTGYEGGISRYGHVIVSAGNKVFVADLAAHDRYNRSEYDIIQDISRASGSYLCYIKRTGMDDLETLLQRRRAGGNMRVKFVGPRPVDAPENVGALKPAEEKNPAWTHPTWLQPPHNVEETEH